MIPATRPDTIYFEKLGVSVCESRIPGFAGRADQQFSGHSGFTQSRGGRTVWRPCLDGEKVRAGLRFSVRPQLLMRHFVIARVWEGHLGVAARLEFESKT
jgi:hypothetical protein